MFKINKHRFNNYVFSIILFEFKYNFLIFFHNYRVLHKNPLTTLRQTPRDSHLGRGLSLGTTAVN
jgi:hypothetical protein